MPLNMKIKIKIVDIKLKILKILNIVKIPFDFLSKKTENWPQWLKFFLCGLCFGFICYMIVGSGKNNNRESEPEYWTNETPLYDRVRILCLILTSEENHMTRAIHVKQTWAKRCNKVIFASSIDDDDLGAKSFDAYDTSEKPWRRTKKMFEYAYVEHLEDYDWFFKAEDDTYAFMDNMRLMLSAYSPNDPIYFGRKLKSNYHRQGYFYGGSGYVMSRQALQRFVEDAIPNEELCRFDWGGMEAYEMGNCMNNIGIYSGDTRDEDRLETFYPSDPESHLFPNFMKNYYDKMYYKSAEGFDHFPNYTITFHHVKPYMMYLIELLVFHFQKYGIQYNHPILDREMDFTWLAGVLDKQYPDE